MRYAILAALMLAGCNTISPSVSGVCDALPQAGHAVRGQTRNDQRWIDVTIETEVRVCGFPRPR